MATTTIEATEDEWRTEGKNPTPPQLDRAYRETIKLLEAAGPPSQSLALVERWRAGVRSPTIGRESPNAEKRLPAFDEADVRMNKARADLLRRYREIYDQARYLAAAAADLRPLTQAEAERLASAELAGRECQNPVCKSPILTGNQRLKRFRGEGPKLCPNCHQAARRDARKRSLSPPV